MLNNYHVEYFIGTIVTKQATLNLECLKIAYLANKMLASLSQIIYDVSQLRI